MKKNFATNILSYFVPINLIKVKGTLPHQLELSLTNGKLVLNSELVNYSYGALLQVFKNTFKEIKLENYSIKNVLVLGFGGGSIAKLLIEKYNANLDIIGVEYDESVLSLYHQYFNDSKLEKVKIYNVDAFDFVLESNKKFDLIIIDIFVENETPERFFTDFFLKNVKDRLASNGIICFNTMINEKNPVFKVNLFVNKFNNFFGSGVVHKFTFNDASNWVITNI